MATLEEIRNKLKSADTKRENAFTGDTTIYPVWKIDAGTKSVIRFLPDADPDNTFFWADRIMINLPFSGVVGGSPNPTIVRVPCMEMYGEKDPIIVETRPWWNDPSLKDLASRYWKKCSYIFQGFVVEDGLKEENRPENPIRRFIVTPQIFTIIKASLMDPDFDALPTHYVDGVDFKITKTEKGRYADYSTSEWARRSRPLSDDELDAIDAHGLFNLKDFLPNKPSEIEQRVIREMFEASVNGEQYDPSRWGQYYKPSGVDGNAADSNDGATKRAAPRAEKTVERAAPAVSARAEPAEEVDDDAPWAPETEAVSKPATTRPTSTRPASTRPAASAPATGGASKAEDLLAIIRNRKPT